jgi:hypothetical protein
MDERYISIGKSINALKRLELEALILLGIKDQLRYDSLEKIEQYIEDRLRGLDAQTAHHKRLVAGFSSDLRAEELEELRTSLREIQRRIGE